MNAPQKKKLLKQSKQKSGRYYTDAEIEKMKMNWTMRSFSMVLYFSIMALKDGNNFGRIKLEGFANKFFSHYKAYDHNLVEIEDMKKAIYNETGFTIK